MSKSAPLNAAQAALSDTFFSLLLDLKAAVYASSASASADVQTALTLLGDAANLLRRDASLHPLAPTTTGEVLFQAASALAGVKRLIKANVAGGFALVSAGDKTALKAQINAALDAITAGLPAAYGAALGEREGAGRFLATGSLGSTVTAFKGMDN